MKEGRMKWVMRGRKGNQAKAKLSRRRKGETKS